MRLLSGVRPATLVLSIAPVAVGGLAAMGYIESTNRQAVNIVCMMGTTPCHLQDMAETQQIIAFFITWLLCLITGLFLQIAANFANDYSDGLRGTDRTRTGTGQNPGPERLVASGINPASVLTAAIINAAIACEAGLALTFITRHWWYLPLGILCLAAAWFYVGGHHPYGYAGLGGVAVFLFFGLVATLGTQYSLLGFITPLGILGSISCGLTACTTLSVNNLRDRKADALAGKRTLAVRLGHKTASILTACEALLSVVALIGASIINRSAFGGCAALLVFSLAVLMVGDLQEDEENVDYRAMFHHSIALTWGMIVGYVMCVIPL